MAKPVYSTCTCESDLSQLRTDWNTQQNPDLIDIEARLTDIALNHLKHDSHIFEQFQTQYTALSERLITEQKSSLDFIAASGGIKSTETRMGPDVKNPSLPTGLRPTLTREPTHIVPAPKPSRSTSQPTRSSGSKSNSGFRITAKVSQESPPKPSSTPSKKSDGHQ